MRGPDYGVSGRQVALRDTKFDEIHSQPEDGGEDDCDTIWGGLDVDYLLVTIVHCHEISLS